MYFVIVLRPYASRHSFLMYKAYHLARTPSKKISQKLDLTGLRLSDTYLEKLCLSWVERIVIKVGKVASFF